MEKCPKCVLLVSGKRKSGKDYFTEELLKTNNGDDWIVIRISAPIKMHFAINSNLSFDELMGPGKYKEKYREEMIRWSESVRKENPGAFCEAAVDMCDAARVKPVWIVSDVRRKTDVEWFRERFGKAVRTIRIDASEDVRTSRGWSFVAGVDDVASECDLDDYDSWDWRFRNDDDVSLKKAVRAIRDFLESLQKSHSDF